MTTGKLTSKLLHCPRCGCVVRHELFQFAYDSADLFDTKRKTFGRGSQCWNCGNFKPVAGGKKLRNALRARVAFSLSGHTLEMAEKEATP